MTDKSAELKPQDVQCPSCAAPPGHPCCPFSRNPAPPPMKGFHKERVTRAFFGHSECADCQSSLRNWWYWVPVNKDDEGEGSEKAICPDCYCRLMGGSGSDLVTSDRGVPPPASHQCPNCGRSDGWHLAEGHPPPPIGDCRKIVWIETPDGMAYWGVRAYTRIGSDGHDTEMGWTANGRAESDIVRYWMDGPHSPEYPKVPK